jgi:hypothetical protein
MKILTVLVLGLYILAYYVGTERGKLNATFTYTNLVDSLDSELAKAREMRITMMEVAYLEGQKDALAKQSRIKYIGDGQYIFTKSPWDDTTSCRLCNDTIVFSNKVEVNIK